MLAGLRGAITIGGMAAAIKLMKHWYVKEQRNLQLQKEKAEAQLQLLKAQVHPHFLFNTLNNIYSHTQGVAPVAAQLVMGLSDMLRFMLYECNQPLVPLSKELTMIRDYISLEKIRYDERFDIHLDIPSGADHLYIAPLLLLPLVENCFKHGASNMLEQPWLNLQIHLKEDLMEMRLMNGKAKEKKQGPNFGIGIENVRKRLQLLYPDRHTLKIMNEEEVFVVTLTLQLECIRSSRKKEENTFVLTNNE
ncbi:two-component system sensor protein [Paraflavitalea soli]|uniref:Two-component system sensor protein n=1 Tax=Paraflavitalea soli TaxID=2315862 RepID=A0A3B7MXA8_9BACT|nr:two-component system sensor protein [Paraflavitalea soli]